MTDYAEIIESVARLLLGEPNRAASNKTELRYGARGSLSVDLTKGTWFDHEIGEGGGVLDLVHRETGLIEDQRVQWLDEHGFHADHHEGPRRGAKANGSGHFNVVKTYDYVDEAGALLFQVCRLDPKDFRQRKPDSHGRDGWSWSVRGVRNVPYRLPELLEALAQGQAVYVVEGEKDADNLWRIGVPATTNAGGAGKWRDELNDYFHDADVVVIEDNDPQKKHPKTGDLMFHEDGRPILPGQDHARAIAEALTPVALRVRVLELKRSWPEMPLKGDVSDWLTAGHTREQLDALVSELPSWSAGQDDESAGTPVALTFIDILRWSGVLPRPRRSAVPDMIPAANVTLLSGEGGVGKTLLMQQLSVATVLGRDWIGKLPEPGPVIFITAEDDEDELHFRYYKIAQHYGADFRQLTDLHLMSLAGKDAVMAAVNSKGIVQPTELFERLRRSAHEIRPRWIGIDTAADVFIVDERSRSEVRQCISLLRGLALAVDTAVILLAHPSLSGIQSGSGLSGSTAWNNSVRSRLYLKSPKKKDRNADDDDDDTIDPVRILEMMKANYSAIAEPVRLTWKDGLLLNEATPTPLQRMSSAAEAKTIFLALLDRYNKQDMTVSANPTARNFAPVVFATMPEAKPLAARDGGRKRLLREAMDSLLSADRLYVGKGPKGMAPSKQNPCLYAGGSLL